jgi:hypothetical protein
MVAAATNVLPCDMIKGHIADAHDTKGWITCKIEGSDRSTDSGMRESHPDDLEQEAQPLILLQDKDVIWLVPT